MEKNFYQQQQPFRETKKQQNQFWKNDQNFDLMKFVHS